MNTFGLADGGRLGDRCSGLNAEREGGLVLGQLGFDGRLDADAIKVEEVGLVARGGRLFAVVGASVVAVADLAVDSDAVFVDLVGAPSAAQKCSVNVV